MAELEPCYVYVIGVKSGPQKIGIAKDVMRRRAEMQTGSPQELRVHFVKAMDRLAALDVEQGAHRLLKSRRTMGEWFDVTREQAIAAIEAATVTTSKRARDGLQQLCVLGWVVGRRLEAALAYRELREYAGRDSADISVGPRAGRTAKLASARIKLDRLTKLIDPAAAPLMEGVVFNGVSLDRFAVDDPSWEAAAAQVQSALDVVADELDRAISA